jgi:metal-responsive CopG/Arc/MetJ family transcriptional regulator
MRQKQHRITIFLDDDEIQRLYNAVAKEKMIPSRLLRKALIEYLKKLEDVNLTEKSKEEEILEDEEPIIL